jgi:hypothetical protein
MFPKNGKHVGVVAFHGKMEAVKFTHSANVAMSMAMAPWTASFPKKLLTLLRQ